MGKITFQQLRDRTQLKVTGRGLISETFLPETLTTQLLTSGQAQYTAIGLRAGDVIANVHVIVSTNATTATLVKAAIYNSAGTQVAVSADASASFNSGTVPRSQAIAVAYTVPSDGLYYVAILAVGGTPPTVLKGPVATAASTAIGANPAPFAQQASLADFPSPSATFAATSVPIWFGVA